MPQVPKDGVPEGTEGGQEAIPREAEETLPKGIAVDKRGRIKLSEAQVSEQVKAFMEAEGWRVHIGHAENNFRHRKDRREVTGCSDYICVEPISRDWFYLECKRPGGKMRESQKLFQLDALKDGCTYIVAEDLDEFKDWYFSYISKDKAH